MSSFISIENDMTNVMSAFDSLEKESPKIQRHILAGIGSKAVSVVKKNYKSQLKKGSGNLYKGVKRMVVKRGNAVVIASKARGENGQFYGFALAQGSTITAKKNKNLVFQIDGRWIRKHSVKLPERNWFQKPVESYIGSSAYKEQIEKLLQKEVDKLLKKGIDIQ
jgi:hypothetical protein